MTAVFTPLNSEPIGQILTAEEYDALPENRYRELVDGVIQVMATPNGRHQYIASRVWQALDRLGRPRFRVIEAMELRLDTVHRRIPDLLVVPVEHYDSERSRYWPHEVLLAVEVVSPGSETLDRRMKPLEYAEAGVPFFWRIEQKPTVIVQAYRLGPKRYQPAGEFRPGDTVLVEGLEWAAVRVSDLEDSAGGPS
jgi:Uma2 family endonuclease